VDECQLVAFSSVRDWSTRNFELFAPYFSFCLEAHVFARVKPVLATAKPFFVDYHSKLGPVSTAWEISRAFTKSWLFAAGKYTNTQTWMFNFVLPRNPREYEQEGVRLT
jgi:hypothetical protein